MEVSTICFGAWGIVGGFNWGPQKESDSIAALRTAYDCGINFFDTAEAYGNGYSEELIARALGDVRDQVIIASKVARSHLAPTDMRGALERSLSALQTDRIDLYQVHWPNHEIPFEDTFGELEKLQEEGKIRAFGVSNFGKNDLGRALKVTSGIVTNQLAYNLLFRAVEHDIQAVCEESSIGILTYSSIMQGLLTGKFASADDVPVDRARTRHFSSSREQTRHGEAGHEDLTFATIGRIRRIAEDAGIPMADLSLAWLIDQPAVTAAIVGARNARQAESNARAGDQELSADILAALSAATEDLKTAMGPNPDPWDFRIS
jgi:aryl-alcohol dehydrogenase-like predicted oxidoreductase